MATPNWYSRRRGKAEEDVYKLDSTKLPSDSVCEILTGLYLKHAQPEPSPRASGSEPRGTLGRAAPQRNDARRVSYLNALVLLLTKEETRSQIGFTTEELMCCLRISLVDESVHIRATALRVLRYLIKTENDVATFNNLRLPYLIVRCMDLMLRNEVERAQALRVVRRVVAVVGSGGVKGAHVEQGLLRCLAAVARAGGNAGEGTGDRLSRPAIATLGEIGVLDPALFIACGGVSAVTRFLQEFATPRMAEALCGVLLHILDAPGSRLAARVDLRCLCAPYCDFNFRPGWSDKNRDEREKRFTCSRLSLLCVLRSWPGVLHFCHPLSDSGLRALVHAGLHLHRLEVRKAILDLLYELLGLPQPEWTDEISVALAAVDPSDFQDSWRLNDGFVAEEGRAILPHLGATGPDIAEIHLSLLLYCFMEAGLLDGLAEVIVTSDTFISVRATILLGQLLHLIHLLIPPEVCSITPPLPSLVSHAAQGKPQALAAIAALQRLHTMLEARPAASSLFLDHIIQYCGGVFEDDDSPKKEPPIKEDTIDLLNDIDYEMETQRHSLGSRSECTSSTNQAALVKSKSTVVNKVAMTKLFNMFDKESDSLLRESMVMQNKDGNTWNWEIIRTILKENGDSSVLQLANSTHRAWTRQVLQYLRPTSNKYSHADMSGAWHAATRAGCQLVRRLLRDSSPEAQRLLEELFFDVNSQVVAILAARTAHECLFSPQHMCNTMCQMYFLFVGQLCHTRIGLKLFHDTGLYKSLLDLSTTTHHSCYVKLVISSLDYTHDSYPREILAKTLTCSIDASRLYATQFLNVLLRASQKSGEMMRRKRPMRHRARESRNGDLDASRANHEDMDTWILRMLVGQLKDESKGVVRCALAILGEACSVPAYLQRLVTMKDAIRKNCGLNRDISIVSPNLGTAGDRGYLLWIHLEVVAAGKTHDPQADALMKKHLEFWTKSYNYRYVRLIDAETHEALTLANDDDGSAPAGSVGSAGSGGRRSMRGSTAPPNLHSALAQHAPGRQHLATVIRHHYQCIKQARSGSEQEVMDLKASLWALGNAATSHQGVELLLALSGGLDDSVFVATVRLAMHCPVYSVRAAAFYVLGLMGCTYIGANLLYELGWLCVRHTRHDRFPIVQEENWSSKSESNEELRRRLTSSPTHDPNRPYDPSRPYDRRCIDNETSEQSDQTDASTADSVRSYRNIVTSVTIERSLTEECEYKMSTPLKDRSVSESSDRLDTKKSQTLPPRGYPSLHDRSISESKTVDILRDSSFDKPNYFHIGPISENRLMVGRMHSMDNSHEGRVRNTSESSTSGVSSCDSVLGRYVFPDRFLTLSPIPSSSSLSAMKGSATRRRVADMPRRTSVTSYSAADAASSPPSQKDMAGYAELKIFNSSRRPHLSESAASGSSDIAELNFMLHGRRSSRPFSSLRERSKAAEERSTKRSLLQYDWKPMSAADNSSRKLQQLESNPVSSRAGPSRGVRLPVHHPPSTDGPCYIGICLPSNLLDIFPTLESTGEAGEEDPVTEINMADSKLSGDDVNQTYTTYTKGVGMSTCIGWMEGPQPWRHEPTSCLACARQRPPSAHELREAFFAGMDSPRPGPSSQSVTEKSPAGGGAGVPMAPGGSLTCTSLDLTCSSPASLDCTLSEPHANVNCEVLKHATRMGNPLWHKQAKPALLSLKQKHPEAFQNVCLYSEVSALLAQGTYMITARRFLQELFLDTTFECFAPEPYQIIMGHQVCIKPIAEKEGT